MDGLTLNSIPGKHGLSSINVPNFSKIHQGVLWTAVDCPGKMFSKKNRLAKKIQSSHFIHPET